MVNLEVKNLTYKSILKDLSISFPENKLVFLSGSNNCGKTTLFRILDKQIETKNSCFYKGIPIEEYNSKEYYDQIQVIIPMEYKFKYLTVEEELYYYNSDSKDIRKILKDLKLTKYKKSFIKELDEEIYLKIILAICLIRNPNVIILDNYLSYFDEKEIKHIIGVLKQYIEEKNLTIIISTIDLKIALDGDYLIVMNNNKVILEGKPMEVLEKDNIINKSGLDMPFMLDLSVKLKDYDLLKELIVDKKELINKLWK